jgi:hypothetical protein
MDINLSAFASSAPRGHQISRKTPQSAGFARTFLTARVNREVAVSLHGLSDCGQRKEKLRTK